MPPPRRAARRRLAAAESPRAVRGSRRLSMPHGEPSKRPRKGLGPGGAAAAAPGEHDDDDDGLPLSDEALLLVFSSLAFSTADLVRCAATCRRWRRLVSADAAFICPRATPRSDPCIRSLALGFFHSQMTDGGAAQQPRFVPLSAAASRLQPSFDALVDGGASRVVASRNGRLVLDLRRCANPKVTHAVSLAVCNPVNAAAAGGVDGLPQLRGKDSPTGPYACTVITAADERGGSDDRRIITRYSSYRVLLLYNRRSFTAVRCYSSDEGSWGPEAEVTGARIGRAQLAVGPHAAIVHRGVVFWHRLGVALRLDSLLQPAAPAVSAANKSSAKTPPPPPPRYTVAGLSTATRQHHSSATHRLLGVMPGGGLLRVEADRETIRAYWGGRKDGDADDGDGDIVDGGCLKGEVGKLKWRWTMKLSLMRLHTVRLRWLCEKSGLVIFTARDNSDQYTHVYTLEVETEEVRRVATAAGGEPSLGEMCGYEMDRWRCSPRSPGEGT